MIEACGFIFLQQTATGTNFIVVQQKIEFCDFILNITLLHGIVKIR